MKFTALLHHLTVDLLRESFYSLKKKAAPGVDGVTWYEYKTGLEDRLSDLHGRVHRGAYGAPPSRRVYIQKEDGRQRPLGVAALEDKIVQYLRLILLVVDPKLSFSALRFNPLCIVFTRECERLATIKIFVTHFVHIANGHLWDPVCVAALVGVKNEALNNGPVSCLLQYARSCLSCLFKHSCFSQVENRHSGKRDRPQRHK